MSFPRDDSFDALDAAAGEQIARGLAFIDKLPRPALLAFLGLFKRTALREWTKLANGMLLSGVREIDYLEPWLWHQLFSRALVDAWLVTFAETGDRLTVRPTTLGLAVHSSWWRRLQLRGEVAGPG